MEEHPAILAWRKLKPGSAGAETCETLKQKNKSAIYRLRGVRPDSTSVIAKRSLRETAEIEQLIYQQILSRLTLPALHFYGCATDDDSRFTWTFLEDAGSAAYAPHDPAHQTLLIDWLAALHTEAARLAPINLPDRGARHYLGQLRSGRARILAHASNPVLTLEESDLLKRVVSRCNCLESKWLRLEELCQRMPRTLVHGDLKEKNMRVTVRNGAAALLIFDWEAAGWGPPGPDLSLCPSLEKYSDLVQRDWPTIELAQIELMLHVGKLFRTLASIDWEASRLEFENLERPIGNMRDYYLPQLNESIQVLELQ